MAASSQGHAEAVGALVAGGAVVDRRRGDGMTAAYAAACRGHAEALGVLLDAGADADSAVFSDGSTPLLVASYNGWTSVARRLLESGANPKQKSTDGTTPLFVAAWHGHPALARTLFAGPRR